MTGSRTNWRINIYLYFTYAIDSIEISFRTSIWYLCSVRNICHGLGRSVAISLEFKNREMFCAWIAIQNDFIYRLHQAIDACCVYLIKIAFDAFCEMCLPFSLCCCAICMQPAEKEMDFLVYPTGAFNHSPFADDVKVGKNPAIRNDACEQRGLLGISYASATLSTLPSKHLNKRKRTPFRWHGFRLQLFLRTHEFSNVFCVAFGFGWLQQDSANSFGFVRCELVPHVCGVVCPPSHLVFRSSYIRFCHGEEIY